MNKLHLIGNAHIDPVWLWRWQEGFSEILATFRSALDRMNDFSDFIFTSACAVYYEWVEKTDPDMFAEIQKRVAEGRWQIVGGWFLQPDCNLPSGESFARHALFSQRYFKEKFGVTAKTGYNVDSFGHNANLPQILRLSGMENYVFMRPSPNENPSLYDLFEWESADGSRVRAFRIPEPYCITLRCLEVLDCINEKTAEKPMMAFYGVGNHGGGPTVELMRDILEKKTENMCFSSPDAYFEETRELEVPIWRGELQHHARGCYSANSFIKKANREAEYSLLAAESLCSLAEELVGAEYPTKKLQKAWKNLMFNQFHDILCGCAIKSAYTDAGYLFGELKSITEQESFKAMTRLCRSIDTRKNAVMPSTKNDWRTWSCGDIGTPIVVFNPHAHAVSSVVEISSVASRLTDDEENEIAFQRIRAEQTNGGEDKYKTVFFATVPALGYKVYRLFTEAKYATDKKFDEVRVDERSLENENLRVEFDSESGEPMSIFDKRRGEYILSEKTGTLLLDEAHCDTWAHNRDSLGEAVGGFSSPEFKVTVRGSVLSTIRVTVRYGASVLTREYSLAAGDDCLTVKSTMDFHEKHRAFKLTLPAGASVRSAIPFGSIERGLGTGEEFCGEWLASGKLGFTSDLVYGFDTDESNVRPTVFRSAIYADHYGVRDEECEFMEQGIGHFAYALFGYTSDADAKRRADSFNSGLRVVYDSFHDGSLGGEYSGASGDIPDSLVVSAVKRGEDGGRAVRFTEYSGESCNAEFKLLGCKVSRAVKPYEICTVKDGINTDLIEYRFDTKQ